MTDQDKNKYREAARRISAAAISAWADDSYESVMRKLKEDEPGDFWFDLAKRSWAYIAESTAEPRDPNERLQ